MQGNSDDATRTRCAGMDHHAQEPLAAGSLVCVVPPGSGWTAVLVRPIDPMATWAVVHVQVELDRHYAWQGWPPPLLEQERRVRWPPQAAAVSSASARVARGAAAVSRAGHRFETPVADESEELGEADSGHSTTDSSPKPPGRQCSPDFGGALLDGLVGGKGPQGPKQAYGPGWSKPAGSLQAGPGRGGESQIDSKSPVFTKVWVSKTDPGAAGAVLYSRQRQALGSFLFSWRGCG